MTDLGWSEKNIENLCQNLERVVGALLLYLPTFVPELKNDKVPHAQWWCWWEGGGLTYFTSFVPKLKNDKIPYLYVCGERKWGLVTYFATFVPEFKKDKIPKCHVSSGWGVLLIYCSTFLPEFNNDKIPNSLCPSEGEGLSYFPTFVPKLKNDKILNSLCPLEEEGVHIISNFCSRVKKWQNPKVPSFLSLVGGGGSLGFGNAWGPSWVPIRGARFSLSNWQEIVLTSRLKRTIVFSFSYLFLPPCRPLVRCSIRAASALLKWKHMNG